MNKVTMETVGKLIKKGCNVLVFTAGMILPYVSMKDVKNIIRYSGVIKYNDVIGAIMDSSMFPSDKRKAVELVPKDCDSETYRAIIQVINSSMFPSDKIKSIELICHE